MTEKKGVAFYTYPGLSRVHKHILEILSFFDRVCSEHEIPYWIDAGTLLGAIRHGGFIPWDDDADVCVLAQHYEKLIKIIFQETRKHSDFFLTSNSKRVRNVADLVINSINNVNSFRIAGNELANSGIDIQNMQILPDDSLLIESTRNTAFKAMAPHFFPRWADSSSESEIEKFIQPGYLTKYDSLAETPEKAVVVYAAHDFLVSMKNDNFDLKRKPFRYNHIFPLGKMQFEGITLSVPGCPAEILNRLYKYNGFPPLSQRTPYFEGSFEGMRKLFQFTLKNFAQHGYKAIPPSLKIFLKKYRKYFFWQPLYNIMPERIADYISDRASQPQVL
ncbi:MAG: LicD family protein [Candidatus Riflebacteria bacterium]|nr:LicD family protein [Candidatus Riflebacteria bacterium]